MMTNVLLTTAAAAYLALTAHAAPQATTPTAPTAAAAAATAITIRYDTTYDNAALSLGSVACSDGPNGLETTHPGWTTLGSVTGFPRVGGSPTVAGWNSANCGACYGITYTNAAGTPTTVYVTAVDAATAGDSFVLSQQAMDQLTGGQAVALGAVSASYALADAGSCA